MITGGSLLDLCMIALLMYDGRVLRFSLDDDSVDPLRPRKIANKLTLDAVSQWSETLQRSLG